jgi:DNA topoisomerase-1
MICGFRIGQKVYQKLYNSTGISTIIVDNIKFKNNSAYISFIGKKGVQNECTIQDPLIVKEL